MRKARAKKHADASAPRDVVSVERGVPAPDDDVVEREARGHVESPVRVLGGVDDRGCHCLHRHDGQIVGHVEVAAEVLVELPERSAIDRQAVVVEGQPDHVSAGGEYSPQRPRREANSLPGRRC